VRAWALLVSGAALIVLGAFLLVRHLANPLRLPVALGLALGLAALSQLLAARRLRASRTLAGIAWSVAAVATAVRPEPTVAVLAGVFGGSLIVGGTVERSCTRGYPGRRTSSSPLRPERSRTCWSGGCAAVAVDLGLHAQGGAERVAASLRRPDHRARRRPPTARTGSGGRHRALADRGPDRWQRGHAARRAGGARRRDGHRTGCDAGSWAVLRDPAGPAPDAGGSSCAPRSSTPSWTLRRPTGSLYTSTDLHGARAAASGLVIVPEGDELPEGGRPVLAYTHGTIGVDRSCAPSLLGPGYAEQM
jgi:hypothetical protein